LVYKRPGTAESELGIVSGLPNSTNLRSLCYLSAVCWTWLQSSTNRKRAWGSAHGVVGSWGRAWVWILRAVDF